MNGGGRDTQVQNQQQLTDPKITTQNQCDQIAKTFFNI